MSAEFVSIAEVLRITLLEPSDLLGMLARGELKSEHAPSGELRIDISTLDVAGLSARDSNPFGVTPAEAELLEEIVAGELTAALDELIEESLALALRWHSENAPDRDNAKE